MSAAAPSVEQSQIDATYNAQRLRLAATITAGVAAAWSHLHKDRPAAIAHVVRLVAAGQTHTVGLVDAYMTAKTLEATSRSIRVGLDPALYTTDTLRGIAA